MQYINFDEVKKAIDLLGNLNQVNAFVCPTQEISDDYLSSERSFYKEKQYEKYTLELKNKLNTI